MKKIWIHKSKSFEEAEEFDREYYRRMSTTERLNIMQELREMYFKFTRHNKKGLSTHARGKGLRRVIKIIQ